MLGLFNNGVEHFLVGVLHFLLRLLLGVVGCTDDPEDCRKTGGRGGGGGITEIVDFRILSDAIGGRCAGGCGVNVRRDGSGGGGGNERGEESGRDEHGKETGCENFD